MSERIIKSFEDKMPDAIEEAFKRPSTIDAVYAIHQIFPEPRRRKRPRTRTLEPKPKGKGTISIHPTNRK